MDNEPEEKRRDPHIQILHATLLLIGVIVFIWLIFVLSEN